LRRPPAIVTSVSEREYVTLVSNKNAYHIVSKVLTKLKFVVFGLTTGPSSTVYEGGGPGS
jgi:hypothetical protein